VPERAAEPAAAIAHPDGARPAADPIGAVAAPFVPARLLAFQRSAGNRAVGRMLAGRRELVRAPRGGEVRRVRRARGELQYGWDHPPTIEEVREALVEDPDVLVRELERCSVVRTLGGVEVFVHPERGAVVRFRRGVYRFDEDPEGARTRPQYAADILRIRQDEDLRGRDPLVVLYEKRWPASFEHGVPSELATIERMYLAIELADTSVLAEVESAFIEMFTDPVFIAVGLGGIVVYVVLWMAPEPIISKSVAGALTLGLLATFSAADLGRFIGATWSFKEGVERARDPARLARLGTQYLERLGPIGANVLITVAGAAAGLVGEAGARAAAGTRAAAPAAGLAVASGGGPSLPMTIVRIIQRGEKIEDLINEGKGLTWISGNEHAVVTLTDGQRALVCGGPGGIEFEAGQIIRIFGHTHPTNAPPSAADMDALMQLGQSQQTVYHGGEVTKVRPRGRP
jgi:hypothetical protein